MLSNQKLYAHQIVYVKLILTVYGFYEDYNIKEL